MNIALGALIITILLLPGAVILKAYYTSLRQKDKDLSIPFAELLFRGLVFSFLAHFVAIGVMKLFSIDVDYQLLYKITVGDKFEISNNEFTKSFLQFGFYNLFLVVILVSVTKWIKRYVLDNNLDIKWHSLRTANFWFLVFSARYLDSNKKGRRDKTDLVYVDIMMPNDIVYSGLLFDFEYSSNKDTIETLTLKNATKRTYVKPEEITNNERENVIHPLKHDEPRRIKGDAFLVLAKDIVNINLIYINVDGDLSEL